MLALQAVAGQPYHIYMAGVLTISTTSCTTPRASCLPHLACSCNFGASSPAGVCSPATAYTGARASFQPLRLRARRSTWPAATAVQPCCSASYLQLLSKPAMHATGDLQDQQQQQQQHEEGQEDRWSTLLCDVLLPHLTSDEQQEPVPRHTAGTIHRLSTRHRQAACASIRHLPLWRYSCGRGRAEALQRTARQQTGQAVAAAKLPELPWDLLTAAGRISSMNVDAQDLRLLNGGCLPDEPAAHTAGNSSSSSSRAGKGGVLRAHLRRLRSLRITDIDSSMKVCFIGVLLGQCPQLTQLVLAMRYTLGPEDPNPGRQLLDGWDLAVSRAGEGAAAAGSGSEAPVLQLPPIQHLEVRGPCAGLPDAWLSLPGAAAQLTALHLTLGSAPGLSSHQLQACSNLRELVIESSPSSPEELPDRDLPQHLVHLTALTKLVLKGCGLTALPAGLWCLTGLRHLDLTHSRIGRTLPSNISRLQQLRVLDLTQTWLRHLPRELGVWLPQLEELVITDSRIWRLPSGLTRLTRLEASACGIRYASYLQYLVQLKQLEMERCQLQPPLQQLSCLTTLETLKLGWVKGAGASYGVAPVSLQGAWPRLRSLTLIYAPLALLSGLPGVAGMGQLTQLFLCGLEPSSLEAIQQLGVLPELQSIYLATSSKEDVPMSWAPAAPWLQQQVRLTRLSMDGGMVEVSFLEQLPAQLEDLFLQWVQRCEVQEEQLSCLARLTRLRRLDLPKETLTRLPPWLSCLSHLEKLVCYGKSFDCSIQSGWEVLATLPLLRQVKVGMTSKLVEHAPHLCWTP